jgi:hypothetical protein
MSTTAITVGQLITLVRKGDDISLRESRELELCIKMLQRSSHAKHADGRTSVLTAAQVAFITHVLPPAITHDVAKLDELMAVYDIETTCGLYDAAETREVTSNARLTYYPAGSQCPRLPQQIRTVDGDDDDDVILGIFRD